MKRIRIMAIILALGILLVGGATGFAAKGDIICACGCAKKAVVCGCPVAQQQLKGA